MAKGKKNPISDKAFFAAMLPYLEADDKPGAVAAAAKMGIGENYMSSRLSNIRKRVFETQGVKLPTFTRGVKASDKVSDAAEIAAMFQKAE